LITSSPYFCILMAVVTIHLPPFLWSIVTVVPSEIVLGAILLFSPIYLVVPGTITDESIVNTIRLCKWFKP
jgi:hypothetical protein